MSQRGQRPNRLSWNGKMYSVDWRADFRFVIILPDGDGTILRHEGWLEDCIPPVPRNLQRAPFTAEILMTAEQIAEWLDASVAMEVRS